LKNGKLGFSYFVAENERRNAFNNAMAASKYSEKTKFAFPKQAKYPKVKTYSKKTAGIEETELRGILGQIIDGMKTYAKRSKVIVEAGCSDVSITNSSGMNANGTYSNFTAYCEAMCEKGMGFGYYSGVEPAKNPYELGNLAGRMANMMDKPEKLETGKHTVVLSIEALHSMLDILLPSLSGELKRKKISALWNKNGEKILSEKFTLLDNPFADASNASEFDGEGVACGKKMLFERGVLKNFFYNLETAALEGAGKKGSCSRNSFASKPSVSPCNLVVASGNFDSFTEELGEFIYVRSVHGVHTSNTTTGDFGVEANIAFRMNGKGSRKGDEIGLKGFIISGNIFNMFNSIIGLEKKQKTYDNLISPDIAFKDVQIIG
jgi:PmbA protein